MTRVIAHRGAPCEAPENTLASFELGIAAGCDMLELDVRLTRDNRLAVIHDATVDRTTNGTGEVAALSWDELRGLTANKGYEVRFPTEQIPSLDEVLAAAGENMLINIEIKNAIASDIATAVAVLDWVNESGVNRQRLLVSCFDRPALYYLADRAPDLMLAIPFKAIPSDMDSLPFQTVHPRHNLVDQAFMNRARAAGKLVNVWTVDDAKEQKRLIELGVDGIMTNDPASLTRLISALS